MFDIGIWELLIIFIIGLLVLGPERLPVAIRAISRWMKAIKTTADNLFSELSQELTTQKMHKDLKKLQQLTMTDVAPNMSDAITQLKQTSESITQSHKKTPQENISTKQSAAIKPKK